MKQFIITSLLCCCLASPILAGSPLSRATGARPLALGNAFVGLADDASALFINPAGLGLLETNNYTSMYSQPDTDTSFASLGGAFPKLWGGTVSAGFRTRSIANVQVSNEVVSSNDQELILSYAKVVRENLAVGADLRFFSQGLSKDLPGYEGAYASGQAADLSLKFSPRPGLGLGAVLQNLGGQLTNRNGTSDAYAANLILGLSYVVRPNILLNCDFSKEGADPLLLHLGVEWWPVKMLALRLGLDQGAKNRSETNTNLTGGLGLKYADITFDYTIYTAAGDNSHYFSVGYIADLHTAETVAKPKTAGFTDVPDGFWAGRQIAQIAALGLMAGQPDGTFQPEGTITRAEFAALLDKIKPGNVASLSDPERPVTRVEAAVIIARFADLPEPTLVPELPFPDLYGRYWATKTIVAVKEAGLLDYLAGAPFQPNQNLTRAEAAYLADKLYLKERSKSVIM